MTHRIAYLPGDGIGPEVLAVARRVVEAAGLDAEWIEGAVGWDEWCHHGEPLPQATRDLLDETDASLFGAITSRPEPEAGRALAPHLQGQGHRYTSPILRIRQEKGLHINVRPNRFWPGVRSPLASPPRDTTLTIFRENTEGLYVGVEARPVPPTLATALADAAPAYRRYSDDTTHDTALSTRIITRAATERLLHAAFRHAATHHHPHVTLAEKANVLRATGGLVIETAEDVATRYPDIALVIANVDALAAELVTRPGAHPVIAATNLFGDILSDIAAGVTGGLGLAPSANIGADHALFEPVHGSAPDIAGQGTANPIAAVLAAGLMAEWLGEPAIRRRIETAVAQVLAAGDTMTPDLGGTSGTRDVERALLEALTGPQPRTTPPHTHA